MTSKQPLQGKTSRIAHVDLLETIAIFFVLICHCPLSDCDFLTNPTAASYIPYYLRTILSTCVPVFFFINGYLLFNRPFELKKHIKRTFHFVFVAVAWTLLSMLIFLTTRHQPITLRSLLMPVLNMDMQYSLNLYWFLGALVCMYIIFPALRVAFDTDKRIIRFFAGICFFFTFLINTLEILLTALRYFFHFGPETLNYPIIEMFYPFRGTYGYSFVYFCLGGLIYEYRDRILKVPAVKRNVASIICIVISCTGLFLTGLLYSRSSGVEVWDVEWEGLDSIFTLINVLCLYILSLNYQKTHKLIRTISQNTLGIYLIHVYFSGVAVWKLRQYEYLTNTPATIVLALVLLFVSLGITLCIRKIPILKKLL